MQLVMDPQPILQILETAMSISHNTHVNRVSNTITTYIQARKSPHKDCSVPDQTDRKCYKFIRVQELSVGSRTASPRSDQSGVVGLASGIALLSLLRRYDGDTFVSRVRCGWRCPGRAEGLQEPGTQYARKHSNSHATAE